MQPSSSSPFPVILHYSTEGSKFWAQFQIRLSQALCRLEAGCQGGVWLAAQAEPGMLKIILGSPGSEKDGGVLLVQLRLSCWRGIVLEFADRLEQIASALPCRKSREQDCPGRMRAWAELEWKSSEMRSMMDFGVPSHPCRSG